MGDNGTAPEIKPYWYFAMKRIEAIDKHIAALKAERVAALIRIAADRERVESSEEKRVE